MNILPTQKYIIILSVLLIPLLVISIIFSSHQTIQTGNIKTENIIQQDQNNLTWNAVQSQNNEVDVFLTGSTASKVTNLDLAVSLDKRIKVSSIEPGGFFVDPVKIKFDSKNLVYSLMTNPDSKIGNDLTKPIFKFILSPDVLTGYNFSILPASLVYLQGVGGAYPAVSQMILK